MTRRGVFKIFVLLMLLILGVVALILFFKNIDTYNNILESINKLSGTLRYEAEKQLSQTLCLIIFFFCVGFLNLVVSLLFAYFFMWKNVDEKIEEIDTIWKHVESLENKTKGLEVVVCRHCGYQLYLDFKENCPSCSRPIREKVENK